MFLFSRYFWLWFGALTLSALALRCGTDDAKLVIPHLETPAHPKHIRRSIDERFLILAYDEARHVSSGKPVAIWARRLGLGRYFKNDFEHFRVFSHNPHVVCVDTTRSARVAPTGSLEPQAARFYYYHQNQGLPAPCSMGASAGLAPWMLEEGLGNEAYITLVPGASGATKIDVYAVQDASARIFNHRCVDDSKCEKVTLTVGTSPFVAAKINAGTSGGWWQIVGPKYVPERSRVQYNLMPLDPTQVDGGYLRDFELPVDSLANPTIGISWPVNSLVMNASFSESCTNANPVCMLMPTLKGYEQYGGPQEGYLAYSYRNQGGFPANHSLYLDVYESLGGGQVNKAERAFMVGFSPGSEGHEQHTQSVKVYSDWRDLFKAQGRLKVHNPFSNGFKKFLEWDSRVFKWIVAPDSATVKNTKELNSCYVNNSSFTAGSTEATCRLSFFKQDSQDITMHFEAGAGAATARAHQGGQACKAVTEARCMPLPWSLQGAHAAYHPNVYWGDELPKGLVYRRISKVAGAYQVGVCLDGQGPLEANKSEALWNNNSGQGFRFVAVGRYPEELTIKKVNIHIHPKGFKSTCTN